jgi:hypothetical protein
MNGNQRTAKAEETAAEEKEAETFRQGSTCKSYFGAQGVKLLEVSRS